MGIGIFGLSLWLKGQTALHHLKVVRYRSTRTEIIPYTLDTMTCSWRTQRSPHSCLYRLASPSPTESRSMRYLTARKGRSVLVPCDGDAQAFVMSKLQCKRWRAQSFISVNPNGRPSCHVCASISPQGPAPDRPIRVTKLLESSASVPCLPSCPPNSGPPLDGCTGPACSLHVSQFCHWSVDQALFATTRTVHLASTKELGIKDA